MPPILLIAIVIFAALMLMLGDSPVDKWRKEQEKYGKDPMERAINRYNEEHADKMQGMNYKPPKGAQVSKLPADQAYVGTRKTKTLPGMVEQEVVPPTEMPALKKGETPSGIVGGSLYPNHMMRAREDAQAPEANPNAVPEATKQQFEPFKPAGM